MNGAQFALILTGVLLNAIAQLLLKAGAGSLARSACALSAAITPATARAAGRQARRNPFIARGAFPAGGP